LFSLLVILVTATPAAGQLFLKLERQFWDPKQYENEDIPPDVAAQLAAEDRYVLVNIHQIQTIEACPMKRRGGAPGWLPGTRIFFRGDRHCDFVNVKPTVDEISKRLKFAKERPYWWAEGLPKLAPFQGYGSGER
jgi:hypothetical protein